MEKHDKIEIKNIDKLSLEKINKIIDSLDKKSLIKLKEDLKQLKKNIKNENINEMIDEIIKKIDDTLNNNEIYLV